MRRIDRGPEPDGVAGYARQFTPGWVAYFRHHIGGRPTDSYWREFRTLLGRRSAGVCWYCERRCAPASAAEDLPVATIDHFKPLRRFPELAYEWSNWIFSCQRCNEYKQDKWPDAGYVDPATADESDSPERYFDYELDSGHIIPRKDLSESARRRASDTINDLGLNKLDVWFRRLDWTRHIVADLRRFPIAERRAFVEFYLEQQGEYAGVTGMAIAQLRQGGEI